MWYVIAALAAWLLTGLAFWALVTASARAEDQARQAALQRRREGWLHGSFVHSSR